MAEERTAVLLPHPATPMAAVRAIAVDVGRPRVDALRLRYRLAGATARLRIPAPRAGGMASRLWEHTCFEAFVAAEGEPGYREINLSPSGDWAIHAFRDYRDGAMLEGDGLAPSVTVTRAPDGLELEAGIALAAWPAAYRAAPLRIGLAAVVEDDVGARSYWALAHEDGRPDFHRGAARILRMPPPPGAAG